MQRAWLLPVAVAFATVTIIALHVPDGRSGVYSMPTPAEGLWVAVPEAAEPASIHRGQSILASIERWEDSLSGISLGHPTGWIPMQLPDVGSRSELLEPGYAIGFESPSSGDGDSFADYLLVEILPGKESGQFVTDGKQRLSVNIDGRIAWRDRLLLEEHPIGDATVDLSIRQAGFEGLGYTVGLYVIGERSQAQYLDDVFEVLLQTFSLHGEPFRVI